jgi:integrase
MPKHLQKRRRLWYAVLDVPKALHEHLGKRKFIQSLETDSLSVAEELKSSVITDWKKQIALAKKSSDGSGNALLDNVIKVRQDTQRLEAEGTSDEDIKWIQEEVALSVALGERNDFSGDPTLANAVSVVTSGSFLFVEHIDEFLDSKTTEQKSKDMMRRDLGLFCKAFQFPEDVTRQKVIKWINVDLDPTKKLALGTKRRIISACSVYWDWLEYNKELTQDPPFTKVLPPKPKKKSKTEIQKLRRSFRVKDYHKLLKATPEHDVNLRHLMMLGAYTGCRLEELCGLKIDNVDTDRMEILDAKSEAGWRTIPIHQHITQLVAELVGTSSSDDGFLLNGLTLNKYGDRSNAIGKRFGRLKTKLEYCEHHVFHSFRKSFATQLENAKIPLNVSARLMGHEISGETFGNYSDGLVFEGLKEAISYIDWTH